MIGIVILNYCSYQDTICLVKELQSQTLSEDLKIIVVDNYSPNGSYKYLKVLESQYDNIVLIQTNENLGYAKGNNFGLKYLAEHVFPDYVAILNNDIVLQNDCFEKLIRKYKILESPAIIAPKQLDIESREVPLFRLNSFLDDCLSLFYIFKIFNKRNILKFADTTGYSAMKVDLVPGSFMFSSFERFKKMGFFYPNTFLFVEERFIAVKARTEGWNNYVLLDQTYIHAHSKTINTVHSQLSKYKLLYKGWLEFTITNRSYGKIKIAILKPLMKLSLLEISLYNRLKSIIKK